MGSFPDFRIIINWPGFYARAAADGGHFVGYAKDTLWRLSEKFHCRVAIFDPVGGLGYVAGVTPHA